MYYSLHQWRILGAEGITCSLTVFILATPVPELISYLVSRLYAYKT